MEKQYAVIDLKSFYASCECAARGLDIFTTPLAVADLERTENSVVMSVTPYLKKHYGCPNVCRIKDLPKLDNLICATPRMAYYLEMSAKVVAIFLEFVSWEDLHVYSVDESFLYLTPYLKMNHCTAIEMVAKIQKRIKDELGLLATAGTGPNMFLAKACLDNEGKKNYPYIARWDYEDVEKKLWKISPITNVWGIGEATAINLARLGIRNLEQLAKVDEAFIQRKLGIIGVQLKMLANGIDNTDMSQEYIPLEKSLSVGQVLPKALTAKEASIIIREMNDDLCRRLREENCLARRVHLSVCLTGGGVVSKRMSLLLATDNTDSLYKSFSNLFNANVPPYGRVKQISLSFGGLIKKTSFQVSLFEKGDEYKKIENINMALDAISKVYGKNTCLRGISYLNCSTAKERHKQIGGHKA